MENKTEGNNAGRTIARVVPERNNGDIWYEGSELKAKVRDDEHSITAQQINDECQKHNDELVKRLDAAQARIKQLEQENGEAFAKYQELLVENRSLKERVKELEDYLADRITAPTKSMIAESFDKAWKLRQVLRMNATEVLIQVLDELGIK